MDPSSLLSTVQDDGDGVMTWGIFLTNFVSFRTDLSLCKCHSLTEYSC